MKLNKKGLIFVVSGPSGCGKTTLGKKLIKNFPDVVLSVSVTTRPRRKGEKSGREYIFVNEKKFVFLKRQNKFLESAKVFGNFYGTLRQTVRKNIKRGKDVILLIDIQGAMQIKKKLPHATFVFINPPSLSVLKERLEKRGLDSAVEAEKRLNRAREEMACNKEYDYNVVNDEIEVALEHLKSIIIAERCRAKK
ncbi:MAG: guanylate kinase [Candidatus Omnitrophica bacterium]|nr:guanylate kinase [Candidatus Omnitrophota bacterium]